MTVAWLFMFDQEKRKTWLWMWWASRKRRRFLFRRVFFKTVHQEDFVFYSFICSRIFSPIEEENACWLFRFTMPAFIKEWWSSRSGKRETLEILPLGQEKVEMSFLSHDRNVYYFSRMRIKNQEFLSRRAWLQWSPLLIHQRRTNADVVQESYSQMLSFSLSSRSRVWIVSSSLNEDALHLTEKAVRKMQKSHSMRKTVSLTSLTPTRRHSHWAMRLAFWFRVFMVLPSICYSLYPSPNHYTIIIASRNYALDCFTLTQDVCVQFITAWMSSVISQFLCRIL